jgi:hypothetical protein
VVSVTCMLFTTELVPVCVCVKLKDDWFGHRVRLMSEVVCLVYECLLFEMIVVCLVYEWLLFEVLLVYMNETECVCAFRCMILYW